MSRILVVDDDLDLCELLAKYLRREGFEFEMVHNGEAGVNRALAGAYALIVLDVMLPNMNGFEVLSQIRGRSQTPVLMLHQFRFSSHVLRLLDRGIIPSRS